MGLIVQDDEISPETLEERKTLFSKVEDMCRTQVKWYETQTPEVYREMRRNGTNGFPKPQLHPGARQISIAGRLGQNVDLRIIAPSSGESRGVMLHFHAGGMVIGSAKSYDGYLLRLANELAITPVSVEYRLAPENKFPAARDDCIDAALFALSASGQAALGGPLKLLAGESAGGTLAMWVALALRDTHRVDVRTQISAILPSCGMYDLTGLPSLFSHKGEAILSGPDMLRFIDAALPDIPRSGRRDPDLSPLYANLVGLPPALFLCGTADPLVDDSMFMAMKWAQAGNYAELALLTEAAHAPMLFPWGEVTEAAVKRIVKFAAQRLS